MNALSNENKEKEKVCPIIGSVMSQSVVMIDDNINIRTTQENIEKYEELIKSNLTINEDFKYISIVRQQLSIDSATATLESESIEIFINKIQ